MKAVSFSRSRQGFTLIELMIVVSMIGIFAGILVPIQLDSHRFTESEVGLQRAIRALQNEVEILRATPYAELRPGQVTPFDVRVEDLNQLVAGRGEVRIERDSRRSDLIVLQVEVFWRDARLGMRSIHTILFRAP